ncbi:MAG TPA: hypothetical protein VGC91_10300 [Pyrinomonadaceae bacterium]|jgi:hypothetical protein
MSKSEEPFSVRFIDTSSKVLLELTNTTTLLYRSVEILTIFLKDEETVGGASRAHIKFDDIKAIQPHEKAVISHKTWIDGQPAAPHQDKLERLKVLAGEAKPYVLDISWQDADGKSRFQRIPVGH